MMEAIEGYLSTVLTPQLVALGLRSVPGVLDAVVADIRRRLQSALAHSKEPGVWNTILLPGREEGWFYLPDTAPHAIRALVVVAVRNSLLEELGTSYSSHLPTPSTTPLMDDRDVRPITEAAIRYWSRLPLQALDCPTLAPAEDCFGPLAAAFPHAWQVLSRLAKAGPSKMPIAPCKAARPPLPAAMGPRHGSALGVVASGMDPQFDATLVEQLRQVQTGKLQILFSDSWRGLTRRPEKLFQIVNFILAHQGTLVTFNYLVTPRLACVRTPLVRPAHEHQEVRWRLEHLELHGLEREHWRALFEASKALAR